LANHRPGIQFSIIVQLLNLNYLTLLNINLPEPSVEKCDVVRPEKINLPVPSLEKCDVVRPENQFGK
jgi:hypothetical protein